MLLCPYCRHASLLGAPPLRREVTRVRHRDIEIPPAVHARISGTYKMAKLRTIWFVSTCFESGYVYTAEGVDRVIHDALNRLEQPGGSGDSSHIRAVLRELKFLESVSGGRGYRKVGGGERKGRSDGG